MLAPQVIDGRTRAVALLGHPTAHSLSPFIHNHAFRTLGLPYAYIAFDVRAEGLGGAVDALRSLGFAGANVTIPHKREAARLCDRLSDLSKLTGAVNTLYFDNGRLVGTTTDPEGFFRALAWMGHEPKDGNIVILGNGGAARSLGFALAAGGIPGTLTFAGRSGERAAALAAEIAAATGFDARHAVIGTDELRKAIARCSLCVNCTPVPAPHPSNPDSSTRA
jgi:shikimate dehydrogenase